MSLNGELGRDAISSQKPVQRTPTHPCQPLKTPAGVWHGEAVADLRRVKRAVLRPGAHTHPLPLHWRFGSPAARRPPAHSPGPQVSALLLQHRPGCHHQPGLLPEDSHPSLQDKQGARRLAGERGPRVSFGSQEARNLPLCLCTLESLGRGTGGASQIPGEIYTQPQGPSKTNASEFSFKEVFSQPQALESIAEGFRDVKRKLSGEKENKQRT